MKVSSPLRWLRDLLWNFWGGNPMGRRRIGQMRRGRRAFLYKGIVQKKRFAQMEIAFIISILECQTGGGGGGILERLEGSGEGADHSGGIP
jgi:hypothetical protein